MIQSPAPSSKQVLSGKRILVTRAFSGHHPCPLAEALEALDATVLALPLTEITPIPPQPLPDFSQYDWLLLTSANAVHALAQKRASLPADLHIAVVGESSATAVEQAFGKRPGFVSAVFEGVTAAKTLAELHTLNAKRVLWACGNLANPDVLQTLQDAGAQVEQLVVYQTTPKASLTAAEEHLLSQGFDAVAFTSPSAVSAFVALAIDLPKTTAIACIGPATAKTARQAPGRVDIIANPHTLADLAHAIACYYQQQL